jgi:putative transposase
MPVHLLVMARMARLVLPGMAFHVVQRGNHRDTVFVTDQDRQVFLKILQEYSERYQLRILGYCLMSNHYHLICLTDRENSMALTFGRANAEYSRGFTSRWIHIQRRQVGQLGRGRYRSCLLDESHLWNALC